MKRIIFAVAFFIFLVHPIFTEELDKGEEIEEYKKQMELLKKDVEVLKEELNKLIERVKNLERVVRNLEIYTKSASSLPPSEESWESLKEDMTKEQVRKLLGEPERIHVFKKREGEEWYYLGLGKVVFDRWGRVIYWRRMSREEWFRQFRQF